MKKMFFVCSLICSVLLFQSCVRHVAEISVAPEKPSYSMLIAADSSAFKDKVRNRIVEKYKATCTVNVVNIADLKTKNTDDYDVVLIMDTCIAWSGFNPSLKSFMDNETNRKKTVLSMTAATPGWTYSYKGVDAVTSASRVEKEDDFFNRIDKDIEKVLATAKQ